jgi:TonB family protein
MRIICFVVAIIGLASCTETRTTEHRIERPILSYTKPKQPSYAPPKGEVKIVSIQYFRVDTLPLIDKPVKRKAGKRKQDAEEIIHMYEDPKLVDSLDRYLKYPEIFLDKKVEGRITLELKIDKAGKIAHVEIISADNSNLARSATSDLVRYARFVPLIIDKRPEPARCIVVVRYRLSEP